MINPALFTILSPALVTSFRLPVETTKPRPLPGRHCVGFLTGAVINNYTMLNTNAVKLGDVPFK